jgi:hypothetical protein
MTNQEFLEHFGILGMKWGRRKARGSNTPTSSEKKQYSDDHLKKVNLKQTREVINDWLSWD